MFRILLSIALLIVSSNLLNAQLLNFQLPATMKLTNTKVDSSSVMYDYEDKNTNVQITVYPDSSRYIIYVSPEGGSHYEFDGEGRLLVMSNSFRTNPTDSTKYASTHVAQAFYPSGALRNYSILFEKEEGEFVRPEMGLYENSYVTEYHENGSLKFKFYFTEPKQEYIEFWDNDKVKIKADYYANGGRFCGNYVEYDKTGKLVAKGRYKDVDDFEYEKKIGEWKYYANGKCVKKTNYIDGVEQK